MKIGKHETHPAADIFPLLEGHDLDDLVADVKAQGLNQAIVLHEEKVLDGRNRYLACEKAGVAPQFETYEGSDPVAFVVSQNLRRRHLNESQRALAASRLKEVLEGAARDRRGAKLKRGGHRPRSCQMAGTGTESAEDAARRLNTSARSVYRAEKVLKKGAPELVRAVEQGALTVSTASALADLPAKEQAEVVAKGKHVATKRAKDLKRRKKAGKAARARGSRTSSAVTGKKTASSPAPAGTAFGDLETVPAGKYRCVYAAPSFEEPFAKPASRPSMSEEEIAALDVKRITHPRGCHLWLWAPWSAIRQGVVHRVLERWGFQWVAEVVWNGQIPGARRWVRSTTEVCVFAIQGPLEMVARDEIGFVDMKREDDAKPPEVRALIERCTAGPRIELFTNEPAPGWDAVEIASAAGGGGTW